MRTNADETPTAASHRINAVITLALRVAASFALVSPCLSAEPPQEVDWKNMMTVAPVTCDAHGRLLAFQSYDETIRRGRTFLLTDHLKWFKEPKESITDEMCKIPYQVSLTRSQLTPNPRRQEKP